MKVLIILASLLLSMNLSFAQGRDPGTGSNTTTGPGPATPDAGMGDTSIMGGGTPGNQGIDTYDVDDPSQKELKQMRQEEGGNNEKPGKQRREKDQKKSEL